MAQYRKRPVVVEAEQIDVPTEIETLEGTMRANAGDWIITGVGGERYPCKDAIFRATYDPVWAVSTTMLTNPGQRFRDRLPFLSFCFGIGLWITGGLTFMIAAL